MKQFVKKKVSFVMVMIMAVITVISMSLPMAVFAQGGGVYANAEKSKFSYAKAQGAPNRTPHRAAAGSVPARGGAYANAEK